MKRVTYTFAVVLALFLGGCAEFMRVWVPPPVATPATLGYPGRSETYWHLLDRSPECRIEDEYPQRVEDITWSGQCKDGLAEGCGTLVNPTKKMTGCFIAGKKTGRFVEENSDWVSVATYSPTARVQESFVEKPGQAERDRVRREAYAAEQAEKRRKDAEEVSQALRNLNTALATSQAYSPAGNGTSHNAPLSTPQAARNPSSVTGAQPSTRGQYAGFVHEICLSSKKAPERSGGEFDVGTTFTNKCNEPIHARWCDAVAGGACDYKGTYGYDLKAGESKTFYRNSKKTTGFLYWACKLSEGGRRIRMDSKPSCIFED